MNPDAGSQGWLEPSHAREKLFDEVLEQLARCDLFSNTTLGKPTIFPVYAHRNDAVGIAHDKCVHDLISWFQKINAGILSDKSALPPLTSDQDDSSAQRNIIANQIRLLPLGDNARPDGTGTRCIDKVLVCGSGVLEGYCTTPYASQYIDQVVNICNSHDVTSDVTLKSQIQDFVHGETSKDGFHHVLTEVAFLRVRKLHRPGRHGMVPVSLNGAHHLPYLSVFGDSDITFKLKSTSAADKHALFFQLLEQLFVQHKDIAHDFKNCYKRVVGDLGLTGNGPVHGETFHGSLNSNMTRMYHEHWSTFSTAMRNGKFNEYAGLLGRHVLDILDEKKAKERREILQWVSPMAAPPMPGKYEKGRARRLDGTCDWIVEDEKFIQWYKSEASAIITLQGRMGMGKTHATSRVIEWIQQSLGESQHHMAFAHFYCIEQDEMRNTATAIIRNIVRQIAAVGPTEGVSLNEAVVNMWNKHGQNAGVHDTTTLDEWEDCLSKLIITFHGVTIVLDALDECKPAQRTDLTKIFSSLVERCSNLKIFVSSRPELDLSRWLEVQSSILMHNNATSKDIATFVREKIAQHPEWPDLEDELKKHMVKTIVEKSQGLFLCAHLQVENLQECLFEEDIRDGLECLPQGLTQLYEKLYLRTTIKPAERKYRDRALRWVLCSLRPLTSDELLYAISQDAHTDRLSPTRRELSEKLILKTCHNFLALDTNKPEQEEFQFFRLLENPPGPVWRLAHQAVAEFFENSGSCSEERAEMHYEAGKVCLMITINTFGGSAVKDSKMDDDICPCGTSLESPYHHALQEPLREYAAHAWPAHMRTNEHQESRNKGGLSRTLLRFLTGPKEGHMPYERWEQHGSCSAHFLPWSTLNKRSLPFNPECKMSPFNLACYLGFPQTVTKLLNSAGMDTNTLYDARRWWPWERAEWISPFYDHSLRWSATALACAHDEAEVLRCLLSADPPARLDTFAADEVPPIVAAAMGDSIKVVRELLQTHHGLSLSSSFTSQHGHVLRFAIRFDSLQVLPLLLDRILVDSPTLEGPFSFVRDRDFESTKTIPLLLEKGVEVNTPLSDATLLAVAASFGDEGLVSELLERDADANLQFRGLDSNGFEVENALEACLNSRGVVDHRLAVARLLVESGATVSAKAVVMALLGLKQHRHGEPDRDVMRLLITRMSDPNEIVTNKRGDTTCALDLAIETGNLAMVELLLESGADQNLSLPEEVEGATRMVSVPSKLFQASLHEWPTAQPQYLTLQMIEVLEEAGADFGSLDGHDLDIALAATAWAGLTKRVRFFLEHGADPNAPTGSRFVTALGAAVASGRPEAPDIVRMLLDMADVNLRLPYQRYPFYAELALDFPLSAILDENHRYRDRDLNHGECLRSWAQSASVLASNGAVWDVDFAQWRECLRQVEPEFESQEADTLDTMQQNLERNWNKLSASQKASDEWRIKDPLAIESGPGDPDTEIYDSDGPDGPQRGVLRKMYEIMRTD
ncbi:hypothetical protein KVR01_013324 [Diaporthe batatas]|uniref:uncharacterized protein n=1 Tax=Diaporthe batatas TaxID=748121 RepID=UPI001D03EF1E|nr:uncharacterized protein KVR01_013324 [Diaporthe batatas]KAG8156911.1 hypothetical protein KVR01_013324 [Diaporthe batatas]